MTRRVKSVERIESPYPLVAGEWRPCKCGRPAVTFDARIVGLHFPRPEGPGSSAGIFWSSFRLRRLKIVLRTDVPAAARRVRIGSGGGAARTATPMMVFRIVGEVVL